MNQAPNNYSGGKHIVEGWGGIEGVKPGNLAFCLVFIPNLGVWSFIVLKKLTFSRGKGGGRSFPREVKGGKALRKARSTYCLQFAQRLKNMNI